MLQRMIGQAGADALRAPFALGDSPALIALFETAGADSPRVDSLMGTGRFPSIRSMVEADLRGWLPIMGVDLTEEQIEEVLAESENVLAEFVQPDGTVVFDSPAIIVECQK